MHVHILIFDVLNEGNPQLTDHDQIVSSDRGCFFVVHYKGNAVFFGLAAAPATPSSGACHAIQRRQLSLLMSQCGLLGKTSRGRATTSGYVRGPYELGG